MEHEIMVHKGRSKLTGLSASPGYVEHVPVTPLPQK